MNEQYWLELIDETNPPELWDVLLMVADWFEERGDDKADGIRWLAENERWPGVINESGEFVEYNGDWYLVPSMGGFDRPWMIPSELFCSSKASPYIESRKSHAYLQAAENFAETRKKRCLPISEGAEDAEQK